MTTDKEIDDRLELLKEISQGRWESVIVHGAPETFYRVKGLNEPKSLEQDRIDCDFVATAPAFEDALIKRVRDLEDAHKRMTETNENLCEYVRQLKSKIPEWQPIETAPKDGTHIFGYADGEMTTVRWVQYGVNGYWSLIICGSFAEDGEWAPTHWQPLPTPPKDDK